MFVLLTLLFSKVLGAPEATIASVDITRFLMKLDAIKTLLAVKGAQPSAILNSCTSWTPTYTRAVRTVGQASQTARPMDIKTVQSSATKAVQCTLHLRDFTVFLESHIASIQPDNLADLLKFAEFALEFTEAVDEFKVFRDQSNYSTSTDTIMVLSRICQRMNRSELSSLCKRIQARMNPSVSTEQRDYASLRKYMYAQLEVDLFADKPTVLAGFHKKLSQIPDICSSLETLHHAAHLHEIAAWLLEWKPPRLCLQDFGAEEHRLHNKFKSELTYLETLIAAALQDPNLHLHYASTIEPSDTLSKLCNEAQIAQLVRAVPCDKPLTCKYLVLWSIFRRVRHHEDFLASSPPVPYSREYPVQRLVPLKQTEKSPVDETHAPTHPDTTHNEHDPLSAQTSDQVDHSAVEKQLNGLENVNINRDDQFKEASVQSKEEENRKTPLIDSTVSPSAPSSFGSDSTQTKAIEVDATSKVQRIARIGITIVVLILLIVAAGTIIYLFALSFCSVSP